MRVAKSTSTTIKFSYALADFSISKGNTSETYFTGSTWTTNEGCLVEVVGQSSLTKRVFNGKTYSYKHYQHIVQFPEGHYGLCPTGDLKRGKLKNPMKKSVNNMGCLGIGPWEVSQEGKHTLEYKTWKAMLTRCYSKKSLLRLPTYKECIVSEEWLNFQNFCESLPNIENYRKWKDNKIQGLWALDKDTKIEGNKIYSENTCIFVTGSENSKESINRLWNKQRKEFKEGRLC